MTKDLFIKKIDKIKNLLKAHRISDAIDQLMKIASVEGDYKSTDTLSQLKQTYSYMIRYMLQGIEDSSRQELFSSITESLYSIADDMLISELSVESPEVFYSTVRTVVLQKLSIENLIRELEDIENQISLLSYSENKGELNNLLNTKYLLYRQVFDILLTSRKNSKINETVLNWITAHPSQSGFSLYIIAALTISLLKYYDSKKLALLIDIYNAQVSESVSAYALSAIVLAINANLKRVECDTELHRKLETLKDSESITSDLILIMKVLMHTFDTERAFVKMRDEVIPELMKIKPDLLKKLGGMDVEDSNSFEDNPEWADILDQNGISEKMREISDMHAEGADLMMISFSNLKNFHFFQSIDSWFLPFDISHPALSGVESMKGIFDKIFSMRDEIVPSDKYSLALAFSKMPKEQTDAMLAQLEMQMTQMNEMLSERGLLSNESSDFDSSVKLFVKLLYRFYKLYNRKNEFSDPFNTIIKFNRFPVISELLTDSELPILSAEYYFKNKDYVSARYWFETVESLMSSDPTYWEKLGFCYQKEKDFSASFEAYNKSAILKDPSLWLLKRLAYVALQCGNIQSAADYYSSALEIEPENPDLLYKAGNVYSSLNAQDQALKCFYHANYLQPDDLKIWRAISWCEILNSNFEKASSYYEKLNAQESNPTDYLNAAHAKLLSKKPMEAMELYKKSYSINKEQFDRDFVADFPLLVQLGADPLTLDLMLDSVKMEE